MENRLPLCVLVAEDDVDTLKLMALLLERHGYDVRAANTFQQAQKFAETGQCELLISDVGLAQDSGFELMRDLKSRYGLKGIAVTGHAEPHDIREAEAAGFDRFLAKPISVDQLLKTVEELSGSIRLEPN
ncbi:MAG TPA: response regulator [Tepidisphaeraceae bacterium]